MIEEAISSKLDRMIGHLDAIRTELGEQGGRLDDLCERMAVVEKGVCDTRDVVDAWTAAKTSMRFIKWVGGLLGVLATLYFAVKGGIGR